MNNGTVNKLLLIDGNSLINRAYYAFGTGGGISYGGNPTNATYGFMNMFLRAIGDIKPDMVAVAFDVRAKTFRHKMYDGYKATRKGMPDDLAVQLDDLKKLLQAMGVAILQCEGYEADDIIGTIAKNTANDVVILSADRDGLQLVCDRVALYLTKTGVTNLDIWTGERVFREYGITPAQLIDVKALMGDKSDNIPGADGVGEKTALGLIQQYKSIEVVYQHLSDIKENLQFKLSNSKENVFISKDLARINTDVPMPFDIEFAFEFPMGKHVYDAFEERGFKSLCKRPSLWKEDYYSTVEEEVIEVAEAKVIEVKDLGELANLQGDRIVITWDDTATYVADHKAQYKITRQVDLLSGGFGDQQISEALKPIYANQTPKAVWDSKSLKQRQIQLDNVDVDIKLCEYLLKNQTNQEPRNVDFETANKLLSKIESMGMMMLYRDVELPLVDVLIGMQKNGTKIDMDKLQEAHDSLKAQIEELSKTIYGFAGTNFNINSPQQLGEILFNKLMIQTTKKTKTGFSTDEHELAKRKDSHPIIASILRYRKVYKLFSTYIQAFGKLVDENGFLHPQYHNTGTVTGRLSSSEPNIQNIPARSEESEIIRKLFVSRYKGGKIVAADYSQIELRLLAHFSGDETLISAFVNNRDIHAETALQIFGEVTPETRRHAKAINFGIVYGISAFGLADGIGCSVSDASKFIEKYFQQFPKVKKYLDGCRDFAIMNGYVKTLFGRRRYLPELNSTNQNTVQFGVRAAMNMPMQGSASDIIKKAMVEIFAKLKETKTDGDNVLMIAQIHDELVFDCPADKIEETKTMIQQIMQDTVKLSVPLVVDVNAKVHF